MRDLATIVGNAELFPVLARWDYFNHAGVSPWPKPTIDAVAAFAQQFGLDCFNTDPFFNLVDQCKSLLRTLVNADHVDEIAIIRNTSDGLGLIGSAIDWKPGDRIVTAASEYPSNVYPWMDAAKRHGCELILVPETRRPDGTVCVSEESLLAACDHPRTRMLAISHVQWTSGQRIDIETLGAFTSSRGILFVVDAIQSLGVVPVDVRRARVDFLVSGGHKWMMCPPGAGVMYVRRELIERFASPVVGWNSVVNPMDWSIKFDLRKDAGRYESGTHAFACLAGMKPSLELLVGVGADAIFAHVKALGDRFARRISAAGYTVLSGRDVASGAVCFEPKAGQNPDELVKTLRREKRIEIAARMGRLRFAPHFYNTHEQVERCADEIANCEMRIAK
jgi:selenocysteine lyase/cysteine desulfurase